MRQSDDDGYMIVCSVGYRPRGRAEDDRDQALATEAGRAAGPFCSQGYDAGTDDIW